MIVICPGEIYLFFEGENKRRPAVVVSREELNRGDYLLMVPLTTTHLETRRGLQNSVYLKRNRHGINKNAIVQAEAITQISKDELSLEEGPICTLDGETFRSLIRAIGYVMSADCEPV